MSQMQHLADAIFQAFNQSCAERRLDIAELLLAALELAQQPQRPDATRLASDAEAAARRLEALRRRGGTMH